nr:uncharacterized protein LOC127303291 [Lolium perenne]
MAMPWSWRSSGRGAEAGTNAKGGARGPGKQRGARPTTCHHTLAPATAHVSPPPDRTHPPGHNHTAHRTHPPTAHRTLSPSIPSQSLTLRPPQISPPISPAAAGSHVAASPRSRLLIACACSRPAPASVDAEPCLDDALGHSFCYANSAANPAAAAYSSSSFRHGISGAALSANSSVPIPLYLSSSIADATGGPMPPPPNYSSRPHHFSSPHFSSTSH